MASVVAYARPFTNNEKSTRTLAVAQVPLNWKSLLSSSEQALHLHLLALRHEALAHSQYSRKPISFYELRTSGYTVQGSTFDILDEQFDIEAVATLCDRWVHECRLKKVALAQSLHAA